MISTQLVAYVVDNVLTNNFQSAYKFGHSTEMQWLRVYNDIVVTFGKGNLSAAFDTIDNSNLFTVLGKQFGTCGNALYIIVLYRSDRKQKV